MKDSRMMTKPFVLPVTRAGSFFVVLLLCLPGTVLSLTVPPPEGYVNDHANILSEREKAGLESLLKRFEAETTNQVVLLVIPSLEGDSLEDFSIRVAEAWKVGQKGKDNGVIFLVAVEDRKARIEVGYGLEGALTDAQSGRILRNLVFPAFRQGAYASGIQAGLVGILQAFRGNSLLSPPVRRRPPGRPGPRRAASCCPCSSSFCSSRERAGSSFWGVSWGVCGEAGVVVWGGGDSVEALAGSVVEGVGLAAAALREAGEPTGKNR